MTERRTRTCTLKVKCADCGENIWCYTDEEIEQLKNQSLNNLEQKKKVEP